MPSQPVDSYGPRPGPIATPEEMLTIAPPPCACMSGIVSRARMKGAWMLTEKPIIQRLVENSETGCAKFVTALLTRMSIGP